MKVLFVWPNKDTFGYKPVGLSLLFAIAKERGWQTSLFDTTGIDFGFATANDLGMQVMINKPIDLAKYGFQKTKIDLEDSFLAALRTFDPDVLAISVLSDEYLIASRITAAAKSARPNLTVIWGGKYPTLNPRLSLERHRADFVCVGEGLDAFGEFLDALGKKGDVYSIPNIWGKKGNVIVENRIRPLRASLDSLPHVEWEIFDKRHFFKPFDGRVYRGGDHMLNWGCPYHCSYCINDFYHKMYDNNYFMRRYSNRRIIDELKRLKARNDLQFFKFHDEDFLLRPINDLKELSSMYRQEVNLPFTIETNPKSVTAEKAGLLKAMNCVSASVAIEAGDSRLRRMLLKRVDSEEDVIRAFSVLKEVGIRTVSFTMLGLPHETRETYKKTVDLTKRADVQYPDIGFFFPFEGTELRDVSIKEGFYSPKDDETMVYQRNRPALHFTNLTEDELMQMLSVFVLYTKLPDCYYGFIERSEKLDDVGARLRRKMIEVFKNTVWCNDGWYRDDGKREKYLQELGCIEQGASVPDAA